MVSAVAASQSASDPLLIVLLGPTASGKTALSLQLAGQFDGEIISCDSVAVYRDFEIGTAKPSQDARARIPHHLIDVASPSAAYTAGDYSRDARAALHGIHDRARLPIVVGGTGLYLRALIDGLFPGPQRSDALRERLAARVRMHGNAYLHRMLQRLDPVSAASIHANDVPKLVRAIEICIAARKPMSSAWQQSGRDALTGYRILRIGLEPDRKLLYERINQRAAAMFDHGLIDETRLLMERYGEPCWPMQSLGYKQARDVLRHEMSLPAAIASAQQGHRNYAKRQGTWFRREPAVHWLSGFGDDANISATASALVRTHQ